MTDTTDYGTVGLADDAIAFNSHGGQEMLKITPDGFWVRGQKVPADDKEPQAVYNAFKQWLAWASIQREE